MQFSTLQLEEMLREKGIDPETLPTREHDEMMKALVCNGGGGGVSSWNDLTDKPFDKKEIMYSWDGVLDGHDTFKDGSTFVKVSDDLPTPDEIGALYLYMDGTPQSSLSGSSHYSDDTVWHDKMWGFLIVCYSTTIKMSGTREVNVPSTGIYFNADYASWGIGGKSVKHIPEEYIPSVFPKLLSVEVGEIDVNGALKNITANMSQAEAFKAVKERNYPLVNMWVYTNGQDISNVNCNGERMFRVNGLMHNHVDAVYIFYFDLEDGTTQKCLKWNADETFEEVAIS